MKIFFIALLAALSISVNATSVIQQDLHAITGDSSLVFQGEVIGLNSYQEDSGAIYTFVEFDIQDVVKGEHSERTITLRYLGGTVGGLTMNVIDSDVPEFGQTGIYFVAKGHSKLTHPLSGWGQGHYIVKDTANGNKIFSSTGKAITGLSFTTNKSQSATRLALNSHEAAGVRLSNKSRDALSPADFKKAVKSLLDD